MCEIATKIFQNLGLDKSKAKCYTIRRSKIRAKNLQIKGTRMISILKKLWQRLTDPTRPLEKQYSKLLKEARDIQRKGDIPAFAKKTREAEEINKKIEELRNKAN